MFLRIYPSSVDTAMLVSPSVVAVQSKIRDSFRPGLPCSLLWSFRAPKRNPHHLFCTIVMLKCLLQQIFGAWQGISKSTWLIVMKFVVDIHDPQRMNPFWWLCRLTFPLAPPSGQTLHLHSGNLTLPNLDSMSFWLVLKYQLWDRILHF